MKKRFGKILGAFLCLGMVLGLMPTQALQVKAADEHKHCVCGAMHKDVGDHTSETEITFTAWKKTDSLPETAGNYYLENDVVISAPTKDEDSMYVGWQVPDDVVLCLNGHSITMTGREQCNAIFISWDKKFTLTDCKNTGKVTHADKEDGKKYTGSAIGVNGGTFNMYGGSITGNDATSDNSWDGRNCGGGVYLGAGNFKMYGGSITNNHSASEGGGVYISTQWDCDFYMYGGNITGNITEKEGGGVYAVSDMTVSGNVNITGNKKADGSVSNVGLYTNSDGKTKTIKIDGDMNGTIGVYTDRVVPTAENPVVIVQGATANKDYSNIITSDSANYKIMRDSSDPTKLVLTGKDATEPTPTEHTHCVCGTNNLSTKGHSCNKNQVWTGVSALSEITTGGYYYLKNDVVLDQYVSNDKSYTCYGWVVPDNVVLCLNGHDIIMKNPLESEVDKTQAENKYYDGYVDVLDIEGHFTLTDCKTGDAQGEITHAKDASGNSYYGRGVDVKGGIFDMYGGKIAGNIGAYDIGGSGIIIRDSSDRTTEGTFKMYGGEISGNVGKTGAGVSVFGGTFYMLGGNVTKNKADSNIGLGDDNGHGGGVYVIYDSKLCISGGSISGNTSNNTGAGVYLTASARENTYWHGGAATLEVSGDAMIINNKNQGKEDNVFLSESATTFETVQAMLILKDIGNSRIGVSTMVTPTTGKPVRIATGAMVDKDYSSIILSDNSAYKVEHDNKDTEGLVLTAIGNYQIINGADGKHTIGKDGTLTFRSNAPFSEFVAVLVDGVKVDRSNYDVSEGSTIVRLNQSFLDTLSKGSHTIAIQSVGGTAVANFTITASSNSGNTGTGGTTGGTTGSGTGSGTGVGTTLSTPTAGITNVQPNGGTQAAQKTTVNAKAPVTGEASPVSCVVLAFIIVGGFALLIAELRRSRQMQKKH